jgi:acyl-CoA synthetase (AMP-forming)/AMP-acid ligase II
MFSQITVPFLDRGGTVEIVDFGSVEQTLQAIEGGATFLSLIPWFGFQLIEGGRERPRTPNAIRVSEVGADRVPMSYFRDFKEVFGVLPREHLGMTEANTYCVNPPDEDQIRLGSVGKLMAEVEVEIRDPAGRALPIGKEGEIWVNTPGRMEEYWHDPEKTRGTLVEGWLATGDAGYMDEDGFLWLSGRVKHIVICDGDNIHPKEVEWEIAEHPLVERACVFGLHHERRGATVAAAIVLRSPDGELTVAELADFLAYRLAEVKIPKDLLVLEDFPETPAGKLDRDALAKMLRG